MKKALKNFVGLIIRFIVVSIIGTITLIAGLLGCCKAVNKLVAKKF